jgi:hypothetical protein
MTLACSTQLSIGSGGRNIAAFNLHSILLMTWLLLERERFHDFGRW